MRRTLQASLLAGTIAAGVFACATTTVCAQMNQMGDMDAAISFDSFQDQLAPYGYWLYSDRWGVVWQPRDVPADFRPYYDAGRWVYTDDYGWYWSSDYAWGDIPFHYGRWVDDPDDGWMWIPGYIWSPGWVAWRSNGSLIGWMPLPPDDAFLEGRGDVAIGLRFGGSDFGGLYARWYGPAFNERRFAENWVFVPAGYVAAPDFRRVVIRDPVRIVNIIRQTRNVTNYVVVNNFVVNRSIDVRVVERAAGRPIPVVRAATVIRRPNLVASITIGQRVQVRMREIVPRGRGVANSAPPPPPRVIAKLSTNVAPQNGRAPAHLFTKATVSAPEAQSRFHGAPVRGAPGAGEPSGGAQGPNGQQQGPNGQQSKGKTGPNGQEPSGTSGPNEEQPSGQPGGAMTPGAPQPGGTTGPNEQRPRRHQPGSAMSPGAPQSNDTSGPNQQQPGAAMSSGAPEPGGMGGPGQRPSREQQPGGAMGPGGPPPNGMNGPGEQRPRGGQPNAAGPNGNASPPNGAQQPPQHKKKKSDQQNSPPQPQ